MVRVQGPSGGGRSSVFFGGDSPQQQQPQTDSLGGRSLSRRSSATSQASSLTPSASASAVGTDSRTQTPRSSQYQNMSQNQHAHPSLPSPPPVPQIPVAYAPRSRDREERPPPNSLPSPRQPPVSLPLSLNSGGSSSTTHDVTLELMVHDLQDKVAEQTLLLQEMFQYIRRIDKDTGMLNDEVAYLRDRLERL
ncbi:hypothetical protein HDU83_003653 [Entophlyctis luteolus]|nr:hypothetical protein HDU82_003017 [Entophlyctis luteolus]KAJ3355358.1 hypothetical protein HDU83_003653 [Entophlyctis luteolus]KAJ3391282.1 hypothetical protein HDU84_006198 [Entophlyctis sp. JEL0112]